MRKKRAISLLLAATMMVSVPVFQTPEMKVTAAGVSWTWNAEYSESGYKKVPVAELTGTADSFDTTGEGSSTGGAQSCGHYENAVDGVTTSYWHTNYAGVNQATTSNGVLNGNNTYTITLTNAKDVAGVTILPRQDAYGNGAIIQGDVQVQYEGSEDWVNVLTDFFIDKHGSAAKYNQNKGEYELLFEAAQQNVKKIKFTAKRTGEQANSTDHTSSGTSAFITAAEFSVLTTEKFESYYNVGANVVTECEEMGTATVSRTQIMQGAPATWTATPNSGYRFVKWQTADGALVSRDAVMSLIPEADTTYYAVFQMKETVTENVMKKSGVEVTLGPGGSVYYGAAGYLYDGNTSDYFDYQFSGAEHGAGYIQVNLGKIYTHFDHLNLRRFAGGGRVYGPTIIALSKDAEFTNPTIIFNSNKGQDGANNTITWNPQIGTTNAGVGTEDLYAETNEGKDFTIPAGTEAQYIRIYTAGNNSGNNESQHIRELEVYVSQEGFVPRSEIVSATAGSAYPASAKDGGADYALDGNTNTWWHSNWNQDVSKTGKFWIDLEFNELTVIDGVNALPREAGTYINGQITAYEVWVSTKSEVKGQTSETDEAWKDDFVKVCSGTWQTSSTAGTWKYTKFEPVKAKHVRLVATATAGYEGANKHVSLIEMRVTTPNSAETSFFKGGALRMDAPEGTASLRFQYEFPQTLNGMTLKTGEWSWNYGTSLDANGKIAEVKSQTVEADKYREEDGTYYSNLVFKNITEANYGKAVYTQLVVPYTNADNTEELNVYTSVENRSVAGVALKIATNYEGVEDKKAQYDYAQNILQNCSGSVQLGTDSSYNGAKADIETCLYTFEASDENYKIYSMDGTTKVWLNIKTGGAQLPNQTTEATISVSCTDEKFVFQDTTQGGGVGGYLFFNNNSDYLFNRNGSVVDNCKFDIYKKAATYSEEQVISGYEKVTNMEGIVDGGKYLITATAGDNIYVLHPSSSGTTFAHVAKVVK